MSRHEFTRMSAHMSVQMSRHMSAHMAKHVFTRTSVPRKRQLVVAYRRRVVSRYGLYSYGPDTCLWKASACSRLSPSRAYGRSSTWTIDMCTRGCRYVCRRVLTRVYGHPCRHVHRHVYRHVHRHAYRHVYQHAYRHVCRPVALLREHKFNLFSALAPHEQHLFISVRADMCTDEGVRAVI